MKQFLICLGLFILIVGGVAISKSAKNKTPDYDIIRVHIRANSNNSEDQNVKFTVKDEIVKLLTPKLEKIEDRKQAYHLIQNELSEIEKVADRILAENGFSYKSRARLSKEDFPTRSYDGIVFEGGEYSALIVELGTGDGNNWWCVMYPPLCFLNGEKTGQEAVEYRSKILELLEKLRK